MTLERLGTIHRIVATVIAAAVTAVACSDDPTICTAMACSNGVTTRIEVTRSAQELVGARLELCRNEQCAFTFLVRDHRTAEGDTIRCDPRRDPPVDFDCGPTLVPALGASNVSFEIRYVVKSPHDLVDGDRFTVRISNANGDVAWAEKTGSIARYEEVHPNGKECDGDYFCRSARF